MQSQKNYTTIEMASRIECKAELLNLIADAPEGNILNIPAWAPERLLKQNKEMLLPLERITEAAKVSKLVTCMSNQETARRILLDHGGDWEDAKEMAIRDEDAAFVLKKMQMRRPQVNSLSLDDNARRKTCRFHNTHRGCKFGDKCRFLHVDKEEKSKEKKTSNSKGPSKQTKQWIMNNKDAVVAMLELGGKCAIWYHAGSLRLAQSKQLRRGATEVNFRGITISPFGSA